jgi:hypothetical protein
VVPQSLRSCPEPFLKSPVQRRNDICSGEAFWLWWETSVFGDPLVRLVVVYTGISKMYLDIPDYLGSIVNISLALRILCQRELQLFLSFWVLTRPVSPSLEEKAAGHYILPLGTCPKLYDAHTLVIHIYLWDIFLYWRRLEKRQINQLLQKRREFYTSDVCDIF